VLYAGRVSLGVVAVVLALSIAIGMPLGIVAGYTGGVVDDVLMRVTDIFMAFPAMLLALALVAVLEPSVTNATLAITVTWWPLYARLARGYGASIANRRYVQANRSLGASHLRTLVHHVVPNCWTPMIVQASLDVGGVIIITASLSYLGLGARDPTAEWGLMVSQGQDVFTTSWWVVTFPGLAILVTALAFNLLGEGLRTRLNPRRFLG
jgi:peptide/nickel transport system permease protein